MAKYSDYYTWQQNVTGFSPEAQEVLKNSTALVSRVGGLGGPLAFSLAAAGVGKIILAHAGELRSDDLNRQILMVHDGLGNPRHEQAGETLRRFNSDLEVVTVGENVSANNAADLVGQSDIVFSCAPLFEERLLMNYESMKQGKFFVDSAMYNTEGQVLAVRPGESACLACHTPKPPESWKRRFPVLGAVSALVAQIGALEGIKLLSGYAPALTNTLMHIDTTTMDLRKISVQRNSNCSHCS
jgi:molybdopterin/thiamine biosynthesis adenylyltransferase